MFYYISNENWHDLCSDRDLVNIAKQVVALDWDKELESFKLWLKFKEHIKDVQFHPTVSPQSKSIINLGRWAHKKLSYPSNGTSRGYLFRASDKTFWRIADLKQVSMDEPIEIWCRYTDDLSLAEWRSSTIAKCILQCYLSDWDRCSFETTCELLSKGYNYD